jgi:hypothetical protein
MATELTARCERSGERWDVTVAEIAGLTTRARRLDLVPAIVQEAARLITGQPADSFDVTVVPALPQAEQDRVDAARAARNRLAQAEAEAAKASRDLVAAFIDTRPGPRR